MPTSEKALEDAIRQWVLVGSSYGAQRVLWKFHNDNAPDADYIAIALGELTSIGIDQKSWATDLGRPIGTEIEQKFSGDREFPVTVEAFTGKTTSDMAESTARAVLRRVQNALNLSSVKELFYMAGLSCFENGSISWLPAIKLSDFQGRAILTVRFYIHDDISEFVGYIDKVELLDKSTGDVIHIPPQE